MARAAATPVRLEPQTAFRLAGHRLSGMVMAAGWKSNRYASWATRLGIVIYREERCFTVITIIFVPGLRDPARVLFRYLS